MSLLAMGPRQLASMPDHQGPVKTPSLLTIIPIDNHHRPECLPQKIRQRRINLIPTINPASEGFIMLIHLLTCLALTAVTLTLFSWIVLDVGQTEEQPS
ncbi:hypothetical protein GBC55_016530 [Pseudomonas sp. TNT3]|nr:hypothetical protein GBC55_016530 [Pseudomonas sp. TNT3]